MIFNVIIISALLMQVARPHPSNNSLPNDTTTTVEDADYWLKQGRAKLQEALSVKLNENVAKNVIFFLGDGMSIPTITSARILHGQREGRPGEEGLLEFEKFTHSGIVKTYCQDYQVPDSASTATALFTGVKTNMAVVGLDGSSIAHDCTSMTEENKLSGIATWSQEQGKRTGIVTTTRVTHASPAAVYAHSPDRYYECDDDLNDDVVRLCPHMKDIARQLVEDEPGSNFNVIMGGGLSFLDGNVTEEQYNMATGCIRKDGRSLWSDWLQEKRNVSVNAHFVRTKSELSMVDTGSADYLMGIFANNHLPFEYVKRENSLDSPTLSHMVEAAINVLDKGGEGYFLFVEGGRIDHAHHHNNAHIALDETIALADAVSVAVNMTSSEDTLIIVTADHSHTMSFSGYPKRGNPIIGVTGKDQTKVSYTTLQYANGPSYNLTVVNGSVSRTDPADQNTLDYNYMQQSMDPLLVETHGGDDVAIYANGPMSHLFQGVIEQNFVAHAMAYASCVGSNRDHCSDKQTRKQPPSS